MHILVANNVGIHTKPTAAAAGITKRLLRTYGKGSLKGFQAAFFAFQAALPVISRQGILRCRQYMKPERRFKTKQPEKSSLKSTRTFQAALGLAIGGAYSESGLRASMVRLPLWSGAETMPSASSWSNSVAALL